MFFGSVFEIGGVIVLKIVLEGKVVFEEVMVLVDYLVVLKVILE